MRLEREESRYIGTYSRAIIHRIIVIAIARGYYSIRYCELSICRAELEREIQDRMHTRRMQNCNIAD